MPKKPTPGQPQDDSDDDLFSSQAAMMLEQQAIEEIEAAKRAGATEEEITAMIEEYLRLKHEYELQQIHQRQMQNNDPGFSW